MKSDQQFILLVANTSWYLVNFKMQLIKELVARGNKVYYFCFSETHTDELIQIGCEPFIALNTNRSKLLKLVRLLKEKNVKKIEHIFGFTLLGTILGSLVVKSRKPKINFYPTITGLGNLFLMPVIGPALVKIIYKIVLRNADHLFVQNKTDQKFFQKLCNSHTRIILVGGSGVDLNKFSFQPINESVKCRILVATRFIDNKGLKELFQAALNLNIKYKSRFEISIAGDLDLSKASRQLKNIIKNCKDCDAFNFLGHIHNMPTKLSEFDGVILPSYREGLSKFLLEAAAVGRPLLVSDVPGCKELVHNGINGLIFCPKNIFSLQKSLEIFINLDIKTKRSMGFASRKLVEKHYSEEVITSQYIEVIN